MNLRFLPSYSTKVMKIYESNIEVAGIHHRLDHALSFACGRNHRLGLRREPGNKHDPNAIMVFGICEGFLFWFITRRYHIGYVPRDIAAKIVRGELFNSITPRLRHIYVAKKNAYITVRLDILGLKKSAPKKN